MVTRNIYKSILHVGAILIFLLACFTEARATDYYFFIVNKSGKIVTYAKYSNNSSSTTVNANRIPAAIKSVNGTNWRFYNGDQLTATSLSNLLTILPEGLPDGLPQVTQPSASYVIDCSSWGEVALADSPVQITTLAGCESPNTSRYPNCIFVFYDYDENSVPDLRNGIYYTLQYHGGYGTNPPTYSYAYYDDVVGSQRVMNTGTSSVTNPENDSKYLWCFKAAVVNGEIDPYDVKIYNALVGTGVSDHFVANPLDSGVGSGPENEDNKLQPASVLSTNRISSFYVATGYYSEEYNITGCPSYNKDSRSNVYYNLWAQYQQNGQTPANFTKSGITSQSNFMINATGNKARPQWASISLTQVTKKYIIVDASGNTIVQALTLSNTLEVPDVIKSPFASYTYYSNQADAIAGTNPINSVTSTTIYVRYTTQSGDFDFNGGTNYFIRTNDNYLYAASSTTLGIESSLSNPPANTRKWKITGNDAYQLTLQNVDNSQYVTYDVSSGEAVPTLSGTGSKFFLHQSTTGQYEVVAITSGYYSTNYYSMGVANSTLKLYSSSNYAMGDDEVQSVIYSQLTCETPVISFDNTTSQVTITCATEGATIHYTMNGDEPTSSSPSTPNPFTISNTTTVKAIATLTGYLDSEKAERTIEKVATPSIQDNGSNAVSITCATPGATIYYAIGSSPVVGTSPTYSAPLTEGVSGQTIYAIAVKENMLNSAEVSETVMLTCDAPVITRNGNSGFIATCAFPATGVTIYYTTDGSTTPTTSTPTHINSGGSVAIALPVTVKAIAVATNYNNSTVTTTTVTQGMGGSGTETDPYTIEYQSDVADFITKANDPALADKYYKVISADPLDFSGAAAITQPFSGNFDGNLQTLTGLQHALFNTVDGGVVKNVMLKGVDISSTADTVGAVTNIAKGYSRIYNCGILPTTANFPEGTHSSVSTSGACAGGLVGRLQDDSRVVNCFSYADVSATNLAAGLVGDNRFASTAEVEEVSGVDKYTHLRTMVVNCMFYGNITSANTYPVYGGEKISNKGIYGINNYNYYYESCLFNNTLEPTAYNCSWPAIYNYLTRYEFHRYLLNSNRELCGWWVGASSAPSTMPTADVQTVPKDASLMAKWVLDRDVAPFPILKHFGKYSSLINIDADSSWRESANKWEGRRLGTLSVTINPGSHAASGISSITKSIPITDMDTLHGDYCYRKIQLPYYNSVFGDPDGATWEAKYGGNYKDYVVTGWDVSATGGNGAAFVANWETGYNFADRNSTEKDENRTFAQGGYYYVPNNVSEITITAHWGKAVYLGNINNNYDRVYYYYLMHLEGSAEPFDSASYVGTAFAPAGIRAASFGDTGSLQTIQTGDIPTVATNSLQNSGNVYDNALVLVGNHQYCAGEKDVNPSSRKFTIMSADFNLDDEPDYCLEWQLGNGTKRRKICPIRFDFLPVEEMGLCLKLDGSTQYFSLGCYKPQGHFEVTETALIRFGQFEFGNIANPIILNGGIYDQYCKGKESNGAGSDRTDYVIIGGNAYLPSFTPGTHVGLSVTTRHCAVNVIGGKIDNLYLAGNYREDITAPNADNPHCYIDGGWFDHVASAGKEGINGNVTWKINHARIKEFYGGGTMSTSHMVVKGNIEVTIDSSRVYKYCGGPKFGDMVLDPEHPEDNKSVTTNATGTFFGVYYGAGNGGTNYVQYDNSDGTRLNPNSFNWGTTGKVNAYHPGEYRSGSSNYMANYNMEMINVSSGSLHNCAVTRTYFFAAQYAATKTGNITNRLTGCIVNTNFYGAGNLGGVVGDVESELIDTKVKGLAFGAGFSAQIPKVTIYEKTKVAPHINLSTGIITPQIEGNATPTDFTTYTWIHTVPPGSGVTQPTTSNPVVTIEGEKYFYTEDPLENLGTVSGNATLTIKGNSIIGTIGDSTTGHVFGGGYESAVTGNTTVILSEGAHVLGNVYGGGNEGPVGGDSEVIIQNVPTISGTTPFTGSTTVTITAAGSEIRYTIDGSTPTSSSPEYTAPITLTETTTVKAIAITNGVSSPVVTKTFTEQ